MYMINCFKVNKEETCNPDSCMKNSFNNKEGLYFCKEIIQRCQEIGLSITNREFYIPYNHIPKIQNDLIFNNSFNVNNLTLYNTNSNGQKKIGFIQRLVLHRSKIDDEKKYTKFNDSLKGNRSDMMKYKESNEMIRKNDLNVLDIFNRSEYTNLILSNFTYYPNIVSEDIQTKKDLKNRNMSNKTVYKPLFSGVKMKISSKHMENRKLKSDLATEKKSDIFSIFLPLHNESKNLLNMFNNIAYLKELPKQSHFDSLETDPQFRCLQSGIHCGINNLLLHCIPISPESESELIPLFIFPCIVGAEENDKLRSQCLNDSCSISVGNETINLYLLPLLPGSLCEENLGTRCISILLLLICSNHKDLPNYIVDCSGLQQGGNYFQNIQGRCDEMSSTCILDGVSSDWNNVTERSYTENTTTLPDLYHTSPSIITRVSTPMPSRSVETNKLEMYEGFPLIKVSMDLNIRCWKPGWHCYNENILLFCSDELMIYNLTSCPDRYPGKKKSYCSSETAMCQDLASGNPFEYTEIEFKCEKAGLQCINEWKLADCGSNMETQFIISCNILFPLDSRATCNRTTDRCQSLQSDLNLLSTISEDEKDFNRESDVQIRKKIHIKHENPNKRKMKNKDGSNNAVNNKNHSYNNKALRAFKSSKVPMKRINYTKP